MRIINTVSEFQEFDLLLHSQTLAPTQHGQRLRLVMKKNHATLMMMKNAWRGNFRRLRYWDSVLRKAESKLRNTDRQPGARKRL